MDTKKTKEELTVEKAALDTTKSVLTTRFTTLQTKEGADAYVAEQILKADKFLAKKPNMTPKNPNNLTMGQFIAFQRALLEKYPAAVVEKEILETEKTLVKLEAEIKEIDDSIKIIDAKAKGG